ncbi:hypothetical protein WA171_006967, partial [Blastocystis sp. BT1]
MDSYIMQRRNTYHRNPLMETITDSKILCIERDLKSRVNQRFHIDPAANEEIRLLVSNILDIVSDKLIEDDANKESDGAKTLIEPEEIQNLFSCVSSLPGMSDVIKQREMTRERRYLM